MRLSTLIAAAAAFGALAGTAAAQPPAGRGGLPDFATLDADKSGSLTKAELTAGLPQQAQQFADRIFEGRDTNTDGSISAAEWAAAPAGRGGASGATSATPATPATPGGAGTTATPATPATPPSRPSGS